MRTGFRILPNIHSSRQPSSNTWVWQMRGTSFSLRSMCILVSSVFCQHQESNGLLCLFPYEDISGGRIVTCERLRETVSSSLGKTHLHPQSQEATTSVTIHCHCLNSRPLNISTREQSTDTAFKVILWIKLKYWILDKWLTHQSKSWLPGPFLTL